MFNKQKLISTFCWKSQLTSDLCISKTFTLLMRILVRKSFPKTVNVERVYKSPCHRRETMLRFHYDP